MDLLHPPPKPIRALPEVPYLCGPHKLNHYVYDRKTWLTFPERIGRPKESLFVARHGDSEGVSTDKAALLQAWLFFGFLIDFLGQDVSQEQFTITHNGQRVVAWKQVHQRLLTWTMNVKSSGPAANAKLKERIDNHSKVAGPWIRSFCKSTSIEEQQSPLPDFISESILYLASLLELAKVSVSAHFPTPFRIPTPAPRSLLAALAAQNWCPSDIYRMRSTLGSLLGIVYLSMLGPNLVDLKHTNCDNKACKAYTITEEDYQQRHVTGCTCHNMMAVDHESVTNLILDSTIPLVVAEIPLFGRPRLEVTTLAERPGPFVAISHVWSDGLGNPTGNVLPHCQVESIQQWCNELFPDSAAGQSVPFWMDTLCIPRANPAKKMAIKAMAGVYRSASAVLVIDKTLLGMSTTVTNMELVARIYSSGWLRRVWTLQEGVHASRLFFQLRNGFVDLETLTQQVSSRLTDHIEFNAGNQLAWEFLKPLIVFTKLHTPGSSGVGIALSSVQFRDTTNRGDDLVCINGVLGWEEVEVERSPQQSAHPNPGPRALSSVQQFFIDQPMLPSDILFGGGRRMIEPGWRWAPAQVTEQRAFVVTGPMTSKATSEGLLGTYHGIHISPVLDGSLQSFFILYDQLANVWLIVKDTSATDDGSVSIQDLEHRPSSKTTSWVDSRKCPAVILQEKLPRDGGTSCTAGVLVDVQYNIGGVMHALFCGSVIVSLLPGEQVQQFNASKAAFRGMQEFAATFGQLMRLGNSAGSGQRWLIS